VLGLDQVRRYAWADEDVNLAWTLAVITGRTPAEVVGAYGGDPEGTAEILPFAQAQVPLDELGTYSLVQVHEVDDYVVAVENNGWRGQSTDVARRASADGGAFISVFWNLNANYKLTQASGGELIASFDPLTVQRPAPIGETYPEWITEVVFTDDGLHAELLAVIEQQTGLTFNQEWLTEPLPTYRVPA
jgi:Family of unknown function (DUF6461)